MTERRHLNGLMKHWPIAAAVIAGAVAWGGLRAQVSSMNTDVTDHEARLRLVETAIIRSEEWHKGVSKDLKALKKAIGVLSGRGL